MKISIFTAAILLIGSSMVFAEDQYVRGHYRDTNGDGVKDTYVDGYHRSKSNNSVDDNYSTRGNSNPWTGEQGSERRSSDYQPYQHNSHQDNPYKNPYR